MGEVKLAIIGCGGMAGAHLRGYAALKKAGFDGFEIAATCDIDENRAISFADRIEEFQGNRPRTYREVEELLEREELDAADVCTPHHQHHTVAIACLERGVDVLVEKPLAVTVKAGRRMIEAAERNGRILAVAEQVRRWISSRAIWWVFSSGMLGEPKLIYTCSVSYRGIDPRNPKVDRPKPWREDIFKGGGGWVLDVGVHYADMLRFIFGEIEEVYAVADNLTRVTYSDGPSTVEDTVNAVLKFENGAVGMWSWSKGAPGASLSYNLFSGRLGSIYSPGHYPTKPELRMWNGEVKGTEELMKMFLESIDEGTRERFFPMGLRDGVAIELYDFIRAVTERGRPEVDGWEGLKAQAVCEAFFESSALGRPVRVEEVLEGGVEVYQKEINERWGIE